MENRNIILDRTNIVPTALGMLSAIVFFLMLAGVQLPLIADFTGGLALLAVLGTLMVVTSFKSPEALNVSSWSNAFVVVETVIALVAIVVVGAGLLNIDLPMIPTAKESFITLGILMLTGWIVTMIHHIVNRDELYLNA